MSAVGSRRSGRGQTRPFRNVGSMSGLPPRADFHALSLQVCEVPKTDSRARALPSWPDESACAPALGVGYLRFAMATPAQDRVQRRVATLLATGMRRRFVSLMAGPAVAWPLSACAQRSEAHRGTAMPNRPALLHGARAAALALPLATEAQQAKRIPRVGILGYGAPAAAEAALRVLRDALRDLGYTGPETIVLELRGAETQDLLPQRAAELVGLNPDVILTPGTAPTQAAKRAPHATP